MSEICECAECVAARKWIAEKTGIGGGPRPLSFLIASHEHMAAREIAEERGRRRGLEEALAAVDAEAEGWTNRTDIWENLTRRIRALAPRDSAPVGTCANFWHPGHGHEIHARREAVGDLSAPHADHVNDSGCLNWKPRYSWKEPKEENAGRWVLPGGGTGFVVPPICNACGEPLLTCNLFVDDGCPCNSPRGVNVKPAACSICRTDNCVKPAHCLWGTRK